MKEHIWKKIQSEYEDLIDYGGLLYENIQDFFATHQSEDIEDYLYIEFSAEQNSE